MVFENGVKNIQAVAYNGPRMVHIFILILSQISSHRLIIRKLL